MNSTMTFEIALDGTLQNVRADIEGFTPDQQLIHRILFAAQKSLMKKLSAWLWQVVIMP